MPSKPITNPNPTGPRTLCGQADPADERADATRLCSIGADVTHTDHSYTIDDTDTTHKALHGHHVNFGCCTE